MDGEGFDRADFRWEFLLYSSQFGSMLTMISLHSLLEVANLGLVFELNILEGFNEFLENIDEILGLVIVFDDWFFIFVDIHLILKLLSEASILID